MSTASTRHRQLYTPPTIILPDPPPPPSPMGLIAATGRLPVMVAMGMKNAGHPVHCVSLGGVHDAELEAWCDTISAVPALGIKSWIRKLRRHGVEHAVMVGRIDKASLLHSWTNALRNLPDILAFSIYWRLRKDRRSHRVLASVSDVLAERGILLIDSTAHIPDQLAATGVMTKSTPSIVQQNDIDFGWPILQEMLRLDIGQAIAVNRGDVVSVEAVEGTDRMIARTGELCSAKGWTLMKAARAGHDRRADVPTVGPQTIQTLHEAGGRCLALAADDVIIVDKAETIALADKLGVAIIGIPRAPLAS
ncbi:MAG: UDP-2,3-diacylglucosamine diphosphatase LpxI [Phycisphaerales bacterium]